MRRLKNGESAPSFAAKTAVILLVSDGNPVYRRFSCDAGIAHRAVNLKRKIRVDGAIHVQNVNSYHSRFKGWLRHFNGVATRHLTNYLGWRWAIDGDRIASAEGFLRAALGFSGIREALINS